MQSHQFLTWNIHTVVFLQIFHNFLFVIFSFFVYIYEVNVAAVINISLYFLMNYYLVIGHYMLPHQF